MGLPHAWCGLAYGGRVIASNGVVAELFGLKPDVTLSSPCLNLLRLRNIWDLTDRSRLGFMASLDKDCDATAALAAASENAWALDAIACWDSPDGRGFVLFCNEL